MRPTPQSLLAQAKTPAFLVTDLTNVRYLSGMALTNGCMLVLPRRFMLFVDGRYREGAERFAREGIVVKDIGELARVLAKINECGVESDEVTLAKMSRLKRKNKSTKFVHTTGVVAEFRRQKEPEELRHMMRARKITQEILRRVPSVLRRSTTEEKLARQLVIWALELGAEGMAFDPIVAFGTNTAIPHHRPTGKLLKKGHIVQIDVGAKYKGYCSDASEVFFTAKPTRDQERIYDTLCEAQKTAMDLIRPGVTNHELDAAARAILQREGIEQAFTHSLGHGVGLEIHEGISLSSRAERTALLKNEVITIEPGVYFPGKFGMRVEDMLVV